LRGIAVLDKITGFAIEPILLRTTTDLIERLANPCVLVDKRQRIASANLAFGQLFGLIPEQLVGLPIFAIADGLLDRPQLRALANGGDGRSWEEVQDLELDLEVPDVGRRVVSVTTVRIQADWFDVGVSLLAFQDNTRRTRLAEERAALATAIDQAANVIAVTDADGLLTYANPAFAQLAGVPMAQLIGSDVIRVLGRRLASTRSDTVACFVCADGWSGRCTTVGGSGPPHLLDVVSAPVRGQRGKVQGHVIVGLDITREHRVEDELRREVADRAAVARTLGRIHPTESVDETAAHLCAEIRTHPGLDAAAVAILWGPNKVVPIVALPEGPGFQARRPLPAAIGRYLRARSADGPWVESCRGAGASAYGRAWAAHALSAVATLPIVGAEGQAGVLIIGTTKGGAAALTRRMPSLVEFGALATALLADLLAARQADAIRQQELWGLIAARDFDPVFQPVVELATGETVGYEALTRFHDGSDPGERFSAAREIGLGKVLEHATMRAALEQARDLPASAWLALNVSAEVVLSGTRLRRLLSEESRQLVLEVTEHEPVADPSKIREAVVRLGDRFRTLRLAVDDAGAGFNGLRFILDLSPDLIKLDRALITDIENDPARQALVVGMEHFAGRLGAQLVAEGVETEAALITLNTLGVTFGQGHLLGRPLPATEWRRPAAARRSATGGG
jgi:PAS domain S-box-containing protein